MHTHKQNNCTLLNCAFTAAGGRDALKTKRAVFSTPGSGLSQGVPWWRYPTLPIKIWQSGSPPAWCLSILSFTIHKSQASDASILWKTWVTWGSGLIGLPGLICNILQWWHDFRTRTSDKDVYVAQGCFDLIWLDPEDCRKGRTLLSEKMLDAKFFCPRIIAKDAHLTIIKHLKEL